MNEKQIDMREGIEDFFNNPIVRGYDLLLLDIYQTAYPIYYINGQKTYGYKVKYDESTKALIEAIKTRRQEYIEMKYHKEEIETK